jgi:hypothetical protein
MDLSGFTRSLGLKSVGATSSDRWVRHLCLLLKFIPSVRLLDVHTNTKVFLDLTTFNQGLNCPLGISTLWGATGLQLLITLA